MKHNPRYPLSHLSIRVPWHDNGWNGTVCNNPTNNGACLILKNCAHNRNDAKEFECAGQSLKDLEEDDYPICVGERATFMADFPFIKHLKHPYIKSSKSTHGHLQATPVRFPAYAAAAVSYQWMLKQSAEERSGYYDLGYDPEMEPVLDWQKGKEDRNHDTWLQVADNQKRFLNCFFEHLEEEISLVFFYAKQVPFVEAKGRVLVGVGLIRKIEASKLYEGSNKKLSAAYWEHMIHHSIRPHAKDGYLLPYHEALAYQVEHPEFDPAELAVITPQDKIMEFSYGSEHVSMDAAIKTLLRCVQSNEKAREKGIGVNHDAIKQWLHDQIHRLEELRGDYPGMGAALCALGMSKGHFVAAELINGMDKKDNPWLLFEKAIEDPGQYLSPYAAKEMSGNPIRTYQRYKKRTDKSRLHLLYLLSRFDLSQEQATILFSKEKREEHSIPFQESDFLSNPYLLYEATRRTAFPIGLDTIDLGLFNPVQCEETVLDLEINDPLDERRLRALAIRQLEYAAELGSTLLPRKQIINQLHHATLHPPCKPNSDHFEGAEELFDGEITLTEMQDESIAYQLKRYHKTRQIIYDKVEKSIKGKRHQLEADWRQLVDEKLDKKEEEQVSEPTTEKSGEQELLARQEKATCLAELAASRFSVLIGPAGTGKTTLLGILAAHDAIKAGGVLFLAPTGKARVRMEEMTRGLGLKASTVAQFLRDYKRYSGSLMQYRFSNQYCESYETVIVDESSMITEEMLATLFDCFKGVKRFILVGDHRQLPPIGAGRPFVDIIHRLLPEDMDKKFPRVGPGYAELTIRRRQGGSGRADLQLAEWFSGNAMEAGADQVIHDMVHNKKNDYLRLEAWENEDDFQKKFEQVLIEELPGMDGIEDVQHFNMSMGSHDGRYFNSTKDAKYRKIEPSINRVDAWQVLSPVREKPFGVRAINRTIHEQFRKDKIRYAYKNFNSPIPEAVGIEEIIYGDKVINLVNKQHTKCYPKDGLNYRANGEIGLVIGQYKQSYHTFKGQPKNVEIEFSSQKGYIYTFKSGQFGEDSDPPLELAFAITVHKSQGSEFDTVFLVVPDPCFLLKREMLYTALTRQKKRVVVLHQGPTLNVKELSSPRHSDTLTRITNLFGAPDLVEHDGVYLEKHLIHLAKDGKLLRSKSELLIYQEMLHAGLEPIYEKPLVIKEVEKLPDFTIEDEYNDITYYWEHCGMMHDKEYVARWQEKYHWYRTNGILPIEEAAADASRKLIVTYDTPVEIDGQTRGAFSLKEVEVYIQKIKGLEHKKED